MRYHLVVWHHKLDDEPQLIIHEVDDCDTVTRMFERFSDGQINMKIREGKNSLVDQPFSIADLKCLDDELTCTEISQESFEVLWSEGSQRKSVDPNF